MEKNDVLMAKVESAESANVPASDLISQMFSGKDEDGWEQAAVELSRNLFDKKNLLMIARLDNDLAYFIVKHLIVLNFYAEYWEKVETQTVFYRSDVYPYYGFRNEIIKKPDYVMSEAYSRWINELLQVTISFKGEGRKEILETMKSAEAKMLESQIRKMNQGVVGKLFG